MSRILEREAVVARLTSEQFPDWTTFWEVLNNPEVLRPLIDKYEKILLSGTEEEQRRTAVENNALLFKDTLKIESDEEEKALFVPLSNQEELNAHFKRLLKLSGIPESLFNTNQIGELGFLIKRAEKGWDIDIVCRQKINLEKGRKISRRTLAAINEATREIANDATNKNVFLSPNEVRVYQSDRRMLDTFLIFTQDQGYPSTFSDLLHHLSWKYNK